MHTTPPSLLKRLRDPAETRAWVSFAELYTPLLYHWARRAGLQEADAADLVQEVFAALVRKLPEFRYEPGGSFRGWLRVVLLNKWRDRGKRRAMAALEDYDPAACQPALADDAEVFAEEEYRQHVVAQALRLMQASFQPNTWKACWEQVVNGRAADEVAVELGLKAGTVYAAKFRVLDDRFINPQPVV